MQTSPFLAYRVLGWAIGCRDGTPSLRPVGTSRLLPILVRGGGLIHVDDVEREPCDLEGGRAEALEHHVERDRGRAGLIDVTSAVEGDLGRRVLDPGARAHPVGADVHEDVERLRAGAA